MAKPFNFDVPIATERTIEYVADVIKTNYATKKEVENAVDNVDLSSVEAKLEGKVDKETGKSLATSAQLTQIETNKSAIASNTSKITTLQSTVDTINTKLNNFVIGTEPSSPKDNMVWFDTKNKLIKVRISGKWETFGAVYQ